MRHTPGPWKIWSNRKGVNGPELGHLITAIHAGEHNNLLFSFAQHVGGKTYSELEANARLIAAAPDMLQMLQELSTWLVCPDCTPETVEHIKARIDAVIQEETPHDQTN